MWFTSRVEAMSIELCLLYLERVHSSATTYCEATDLLGNSALTAWSPSLLDLFSFSIFPSYNIISLSLSVNSYRLLHTCFYEPAADYSNILHIEYRTSA